MSGHEGEPYVIVDIGCGEFPFPLDPDRRAIEAGQEYRGFDLFTSPRANMPLLNNMLQERFARTGGRGSIERADATALPLEDGIADEVLLINILSSPRVDRHGIVSEVGRIIRRPTGLVTVVDTYAAKSYPLTYVRAALGRFGLWQLNYADDQDPEAIGAYSRPLRNGGQYIGLFGFPPGDVTNTPTAGLQSKVSCRSIDKSEIGGIDRMATAQQEYHGKVAQVKEKVNTERNSMAGAKAEAEASKGRIGEVQGKWAEFVTALAGARTSHESFVGSLGAAAAHHKEKVAPAQGAVKNGQGETETAYAQLISDIKHPAIQKFASILGALGESIKQEDAVVARLGENYDTMTGEANARATALEQLHTAASAYKEGRLDPQQQIIGSTPEHYEAQMGGATQGMEALDAYIAST